MTYNVGEVGLCAIAVHQTMHSYKTLDRLKAVTGALRSLDLLGQLPLRSPLIAVSDEDHDRLALADDWQAVADDLLDAFKRYSELMQREQASSLAVRKETLAELADALSRLAEDVEGRHDQVERQMKLLHDQLQDLTG